MISTSSGNSDGRQQAGATDAPDATAAETTAIPAARRQATPAPAGTYWSIEDCAWVRRKDLPGSAPTA
jgi:hypothetical protein